MLKTSTFPPHFMQNIHHWNLIVASAALVSVEVEEVRLEAGAEAGAGAGFV